jgi:hypothetical protein
MSTIRASALALGVVLALGAPAYAGPINLTGGTPGAIPGSGSTNDFVQRLFPGDPHSGYDIGGYFGAQISVDVPSKLLFEYFGAEAGFHNEFYYGPDKLFDHSGGLIIAPNLSSPFAFRTVLAGPGLLPFEFRVDNNSARVTNGSNPDDSSHDAGVNFFASCDPFGTSAGSGRTSCSSVYLFLDDGGAGPDDNHDDFLVRVTAAPVPEPGAGTLGLLVLGLIGFAGRRLRK